MPSDALRIALISEPASPTPGAARRTGRDALVRALVRRGHRVDLLARRDSPSQPALAEVETGVRLLHVDAGPPAPVPEERLLELVPEFARNATRLLATEDPQHVCDLLHAEGAWSGFVGLRLARACGLPLVVGLSALGLARPGEPGGAPLNERIGIERTLVQQADALIAASPQDRADLMRLYGARAARISTVPHGVDAERFTPGDKAQARLALGWADDEFTLLHAGPLTPEAGVDDAIHALARLPDPRRVRLVIAGGDAQAASADPFTGPHTTGAHTAAMTGPVIHPINDTLADRSKGAPASLFADHLPRLQALARAAGVSERVFFAGPCAGPRLRTCCVAADVLLAVPWHESARHPVLEAMACGTPVLGSTVGSIRHAVVPGVSGCLVPPRDPAALAGQLLALQARPPLVRALGRGAAQRVRTLFTWDRVAAELAALYRSLAPAARPQRRRLGLGPVNATEVTA